MRKLFVLTILMTLINCTNDDTSSDTVVPDKIYKFDALLRTQKEVDDFGEKNYTHITRGLIIGALNSNADEITNLKKLSNIKSVSGLVITGQKSIKNLEELVNLTEVKDIINISGNESLENINSLRNLKINKFNRLLISGNAKLNTINGLSGFTEIESIVIAGNEALPNLKGLEGIKDTQGVSIEGNQKIINLEGLENLTNTEFLYIRANINLENIDALTNLSKVGSGLDISANPKLNHINALNGTIQNITKIRIADNTSFTNFCGLQLHLLSNYSGEYTVTGNAYNPSVQDLLNQDCSL